MIQVKFHLSDFAQFILIRWYGTKACREQESSCRLFLRSHRKDESRLVILFIFFVLRAYQFPRLKRFSLLCFLTLTLPTIICGRVRLLDWPLKFFGDYLRVAILLFAADVLIVCGASQQSEKVMPMIFHLAVRQVSRYVLYIHAIKYGKTHLIVMVMIQV